MYATPHVEVTWLVHPTTPDVELGLRVSCVDQGPVGRLVRKGQAPACTRNIGGALYSVLEGPVPSTGGALYSVAPCTKHRRCPRLGTGLVQGASGLARPLALVRDRVPWKLGNL